MGWLGILSPICVLVSAVVPILSVRVLKPTLLVVALIASLLLLLLLLLTSSRSKDVLNDLSGFDALNSLFFRGFVSIRDGGSEDIFYNAPRKAFYEEFDGFGIGEVVTIMALDSHGLSFSTI